MTSYFHDAKNISYGAVMVWTGEYEISSYFRNCPYQQKGVFEIIFKNAW